MNSMQVSEDDTTILEEAAYWADIAVIGDDTGADRHKELVAWLRRSPRHLECFVDMCDVVESRDAVPASAAALRQQPADVCVPHFLSQAVHDYLLSTKQAREVLRTQKKQRRRADGALSSGEIAVALGYLTPEQCHEIEAARKRSVAASHSHRDPADSGGWRLSFALQGIVALATLAIGITMALLLGLNVRDLTFLNITGGALLLGILTALLPRNALLFLRRRVPRFSRSISFARGLTAFAGPITAGLFLLIALRLPVTNLPEGLPLFGSRTNVMLTIGSLMVFSNLAVAASAAFQARLKDYLEWRHDILFNLDLKVNRFTASRTKHGRDVLRQEILEVAAQVLSTNPWLRISRSFLKWMKGPAAVSVCYLSPEPQERHFNIVAMNKVGTPAEVREMFDICKDKHRPVALNEAAYAEALKRCMNENGRLDRAKFKNLPNRHEFISLTGFVSAKRQARHSNDVMDCLAFDHDYLKFWHRKRFSPAAMGWLDFRTVAAYPVVPIPSGPGLVDVFIAFANVPNGFTECDHATLRKIASLLSMIASKRDEATERVVLSQREVCRSANDAFAADPILAVEPPNLVSHALVPFMKLVFTGNTVVRQMKQIGKRMEAPENRAGDGLR